MDNSNIILLESLKSSHQTTRRWYSTVYRQPAIRLIMFIAIGIGCQFILPLNWLWIFSVLVCSFILLIVTIIHRLRSVQFPAYVFGCVAVGMMITCVSQKTILPTQQPFPIETDAVIRGQIREVISLDSAYIRCIVDGIIDTKLFQTGTYICTINIPTSKGKYVKLGVDIVLYCILKVPQPQYLPTEFSEACLLCYQADFVDCHSI